MDIRSASRIGAGLILTVAGAAVAYVPTPTEILRLWLDGAKQVKSLHIRQEVELLDGDLAAGAPPRVEDQVWIRRGQGDLRRVQKYPRGTVETIVRGGQAARRSTGARENLDTADVLAPPWNLIFTDEPKDILRLLARQGFGGVEAAELTRLDGKPVYRIGGSDDAWIVFDKENGRPLAVRHKARTYLFNAYGPDGLCPREIEVRLGDKPLERVRVKDLRTNAPVADEFFNFKRLDRAADEPKKKR